MIKGRILVVDDERGMCELLDQQLSNNGFAVDTALSAEEALALLKHQDFDLVVTDIKMPGANGLEMCGRIAANYPNLPVIVLTAFGTLDTAIEAIRVGAFDFITKPISSETLLATVDRALVHAEGRAKLKRLTMDSPPSKVARKEILGTSHVMAELRHLVRKVAAVDSSVCLVGESGTGKELVAREIHNQSTRASKPFIVASSAMLTDLFPKNVSSEREGINLFEAADGGTLFLDEVADLPLSLQAKLLRSIEEYTSAPSESASTAVPRVRLITSTNQDLDALVTARTFREDLLFRIRVIRLNLPPLRQRRGDVLLLAHHFSVLYAKRFGKSVLGIAEPVAERLLSYNWPGNVRELRNVMEQAVALAHYDRITVDDLAEPIRSYRQSPWAGQDPEARRLMSMDEMERHYILHVLQELGGNKVLAAKVLGLDRKTLYRKLDRYNNEGRS